MITEPTVIKERPILFSPAMVKAILDGRKTQTRRVVKGAALEWLAADMFTPEFVALQENYLCPYGYPGDRLWVRETFYVQESIWEKDRGLQPIHYRADITDPWEVEDYFLKPSIHMPRWASRLTLEITKIRVERLQEISEEDAKAEGVRFTDFGDDYGYMKQQKPGFHVGEVSSYEECHGTAKTCFGGLWETIHAKDGMGWEKNPWVWVIQFRVVQKP